MKKIFYLIPVIIVGILIYTFFGQSSKPLNTKQDLQPLAIGDTVPDVYLSSILNYHKESGNLSEFMDKPLIIDFWFIGCANCVKLMPHLDSIQQKHKGELNVLLSTHDAKERVKDFFDRSRPVEGIKFTQVVNDSVLKQLFPATRFPHQVWIDKHGVVKAITDGQSATHENVERFIQGRGFDFVPKIDNIINPVEPIMLYNYDESKEAILQYSYLSKYRSEFGSRSWRIVIDSTLRIFHFKSVNSHFQLLYDHAYFGGNGNSFERHMKTRIVREDDGSTLPLAVNTQNYDQYYCYDLIARYDTTKNGVKKAIQKFMVNDLDNTFNVTSHEEVRMIKCWVLKKHGNSKKFLEPTDKGMGYTENVQELIPGKKLICHNLPSSFITMHFNYNSDHPFVDEIEYEGKKYFDRISFEMTWNPNDTDAMSKELRQYGLDIALEERPRKVIVIRDK